MNAIQIRLSAMYPKRDLKARDEWKDIFIELHLQTFGAKKEVELSFLSTFGLLNYVLNFDVGLKSHVRFHFIYSHRVSYDFYLV